MATKPQAAKQAITKASKMKASRSETNTGNFVAGFSADRHLSAYVLDRHPKHIAAAWIDSRKGGKVKPDENMLRWMDWLADAVLNPPTARVRPKKNTARDVGLWYEVQILRDKKGIRMTTATYGKIGQPYGLSASAVKMIVSRIQEAFDDPYSVRAFRE